MFYCSLAISQVKTIASSKVNITETVEGPIDSAEKKVFSCEAVEVDAKLKDSSHWVTYLIKNLLLDSLAQDTIPKRIYNIAAIFIIDKEGCIKDVKIQNDPGYGLGNKVVNVISSYKEK